MSNYRFWINFPQNAINLFLCFLVRNIRPMNLFFGKYFSSGIKFLKLLSDLCSETKFELKIKPTINPKTTIDFGISVLVQKIF